MIQLTGDCPSNNESGKMPLLNTEVWVGDNKVQYEHYRKPSSNPLLMLEMSAMPANVKRSVLTQEVVTTMKNISPALQDDIISIFCPQQRMKLKILILFQENVAFYTFSIGSYNPVF